MSIKDKINQKRMFVKAVKNWTKDTGYSRPKDYDYTSTDDSITIHFKGNQELKNRVLKSLDSGVEFCLRATRK